MMLPLNLSRSDNVANWHMFVVPTQLRFTQVKHKKLVPGDVDISDKGIHTSPEEFRDRIMDGETGRTPTVILDVRNGYEWVRLHFRNESLSPLNQICHDIVSPGSWPVCRQRAPSLQPLRRLRWQRISRTLSKFVF